MAPDRLTPALRAARLARGLTQAQLAAAVGITQGDVSNLELGYHLPSGLRKALAIARALDSTVEALWPRLTVVGTPSPKRPPQPRGPHGAKTGPERPRRTLKSPGLLKMGGK